MATRFKIRRKTMLVVSVIAGMSLLMSIASCFISPHFLWVNAFFGLFFPINVFINFVLICYWIKYKPKLALIPLIPFVLSTFFFNRVFTINFEKEKRTGIKVMTWNVKCFDLYNWSMNKETGEKMMNVIKNENPDVLCFQEFYTDEQKFHNLEFIRDKLGYKYVHFYKTLTLRNTDHWGIVTFSKFPIKNKENIVFENSKNNACIITEIEANNKIYRIFNTHLQSVHFGYDDYNYIEQLKSDIKLTDAEKTKSIFLKLKKAFVYRADQIKLIREQMNGENAVLCGDFNDISMSYTYQYLRKDMKDAFIERGSGFSRTMNMIIPYLRIDFILVDKDLQVNSYKRIKKNLSDHYPVVSYIE